MEVSDIRHLIAVFEQAKEYPLVIRDMVLEGDAVDQIAYILGKASTATTLKDVSHIFKWLEDNDETELYDELLHAHWSVAGVPDKL